MKASPENSSKFWFTFPIKSALLLTLLVFCVGNLFAKVYFDKNPVLVSDTLLEVNPKTFLRSSLDPFTENIYFSSLNRYFLLGRILPKQVFKKENLALQEILALNQFYTGDSYKSAETLTTLFNSATDSLQKASLCLNLIKLNYLNSRLDKALAFLKTAKSSLSEFYTYNQKYNLLFTEAKIALTQGLTGKAENLVITRLLPMSTKVKGKHNEFNCYLFLGKIYLRARQLTQAKWFFIQANSIAVNQNYIDGEIETSLLLAKTKISVGDNVVALQDLAKARRLIDKNHGIYLADLRELTRLAKK